MSLTVLSATNAKGREQPYKLFDGGGLHLLVKSNGRRYWRMNYRFKGKYKTLAFGIFPAVSLAEARIKRVEAKELLAEGRDPSVQRRIEKLTGGLSAGNTFKEVADEWVEKLEREGRAKATLSKIRWLLSFTTPLIGARPIDKITTPELLAVLRTVEVRGRYESARRLRGTCGQVFRYAIATGRATRNISVDLHGALTTPKVTHRAALLEPKAVGGLLRAIESFEGQPTTHAALRLAPHVFVRPGELRQAEWEEFNFDEQVWTIPEHKTKMRRPQKVPLSRQAIIILQNIHPITGRGNFVFPSLRTRERPLSENSINAALRRLGYGKEDMTAHGFRATASTLLNEMGSWNPDAIVRHNPAAQIRLKIAHQQKYAVIKTTFDPFFMAFHIFASLVFVVRKFKQYDKYLIFLLSTWVGRVLSLRGTLRAQSQPVAHLFHFLLDEFLIVKGICQCGDTLAAGKKMHRQFIGVCLTAKSYELLAQPGPEQRK